MRQRLPPITSHGFAQALLSFIRGYKHYSFHSESFTAKNHVSARHSIQMLHQHPGACLSAFLAIPTSGLRHFH
jgi:hypothetical protein